MGVASKNPSNQKEINEMNRDCFYPSRLLIQEFEKNVDRHIFFYKSNFEFFKAKMNELVRQTNHLTKKNCVEKIIKIALLGKYYVKLNS